MSINFQRGRNVVCVGKIYNDGFGAIVMLGNMSKPWIWKVKV